MKDIEIIQLIKEDENAGFTIMYQEFFDASCAVMHRKGLNSDEEKKDVFQTSLMAFIVTIRKGDFQLSSKLSTFFFGIVIRQCYKVFNYKSKFIGNTYGEEEEDLLSLIPDNNLLEDKVTHEEINEIIQKEMGDSSKMQILKMMYIEGKSQQEIADELGFAGTDSIKSQKYKGMKMIKTKLAKKYREEDLKYYID